MTQDYERKGGIHSKVNTKEFEEGFDRIFRKSQQCVDKKSHEDKCPCTNADKDVKEEHDQSSH